MTDTDSGVKRRLLLGALRAFQARGIRAVSTTELARELGVSKATLYAHYPSKEGLVRDALMHVLDELWKQATAAAQQQATPRQKLKTFFAVAATSTQTFPPGVLHDLDREYPQLQQELFAYRAQRLARLAGLLESAQQQGHIRADLNVSAAVRVIQGVVDTMTTPAFQERTDMTAQDIPLYVGLLIDGLFAGESQGQ